MSTSGYKRPMACLIVMAAASARADVVEIVASQDATLFEDAAGALADGGGPGLFAGYTLRNSSRFRRALLKFDLDAVPADAVILDVRLSLYVSRAISDNNPVTVHATTRQWSEGPTGAEGGGGGGGPAAPGDATWSHANWPSVAWSSPGGDFVARPVASALVGYDGPVVWTSTADFVSLVRRWQENPSSNHGLLLKGDETSNGSAKRFDSREGSVPSRRPTLIVSFAPCPADFNRDGGVDGADVAGFFERWEQGDARSDVNLDGGVDGSDVERFFLVWEAGGC
ncbi:MAG: DNRLRE domain-containing protein [Phycisphaerae bacterium]